MCPFACALGCSMKYCLIAKILWHKMHKTCKFWPNTGHQGVLLKKWILHFAPAWLYGTLCTGLGMCMYLVGSGAAAAQSSCSEIERLLSLWWCHQYGAKLGTQMWQPAIWQREQAWPRAHACFVATFVGERCGVLTCNCFEGEVGSAAKMLWTTLKMLEFLAPLGGMNLAAVTCQALWTWHGLPMLHVGHKCALTGMCPP
jgi:hypothetical protein